MADSFGEKLLEVQTKANENKKPVEIVIQNDNTTNALVVSGNFVGIGNSNRNISCSSNVQSDLFDIEFIQVECD